MNIESLREFIVLGKTLSFTAGAKSLYLDQSTLSRHLQGLEKEIGVKLINRLSTSISLTATGKVLLEEMIDIVSLYDQAMANVQACAQHQVPVLVLGGALVEPGISRCVATTISLVSRHHRPVSVTLLDAHISVPLTRIAANDPLKCVKNGTVDIAIVFGCESGDWAGLNRKVLYRDKFVAFVPEGHPLLLKAPIQLKDLCDWTIITITPFDTHNSRIMEACYSSGFELKTKTRIGESIGEILVSRHADEIFLFNSSSKELVSPTSVSGLVCLEIDDPAAYFETQAIWCSDNKNNGIPTFLNALEEACNLLNYEKTNA
ncbi:MAG: LysR family transcriptional regulator [Coriobacteriales bacterium]|nr:LysR family transcriptional regulator [Coriobacteriales bacterium]